MTPHRKIFTVGMHHEVLEYWAACRRSLPSAPAVLSLDFHTDVLCCGRRGVPLPGTGAFADADGVRRAVRELRHDEHFDWALRAGIVSRGVILSLSRCAVPPEHPALEVRCDRNIPELQTILNSPERFRETAGMVLEDRFLVPLLADGFPAPPFILDIDCDCILCEAALHPGECSRIRDLAARAEIVTVSREDEWVKLLRLPGEKITGGFIAEKLENLLFGNV